MTQSGHCVPRFSHTDTKKQLIGSLQQNGDAARLELVWQLVEMNAGVARLGSWSSSPTQQHLVSVDGTGCMILRVVVGDKIGVIVLQSKAKARQASKLAEIRKTLIAAGYDTTAKQALALGISRSTAWVVLNRDNRAGPSAVVIKRILSSPDLPPAVRRKIAEYINEKIAGLYGHGKNRTRWFRDQFRAPVSNDGQVRTGVSTSA
jgi:hypothetical protein